MDALVAAFVAALLCQVSDRTSWLAAILGSRFGAGRVIAGGVVAFAAANAIAATGGALVAPLLTPNAKALFLALALASAGIGAVPRPKMPDRLEGWRLGGVLTSALGLFILDVGDRTPFVTSALAAKTAHPVLAAVGATLGSIVVLVTMAVLGEEERAQLPIRAVQVTVGGLLIVVAVFIALSALRLT